MISSFHHRLFRVIGLCILFIFLFAIPQNIGFMAGKVYAVVGEKLSISLNEMPSGSDASWTLSKNGGIIETKTGKSYSKSFDASGEYVLRVTASGKDGFSAETVIDISVGASFPNFSPLKAVLTSVPAAQNGFIDLPGQSAKVTFSFMNSTGSIKTFALEGDLYSDANGDGIIDNDIENKNDISYSSGSYFQKTYTNDGIPKKVLLTVTNEKGETSTDTILIRFSDAATKASEEKQAKPLAAHLGSIPPANAQGNIPVSGKPATVLLYASESDGKIQEYRIDTNDKVDSNNDGNFTNDSDNAGTDSLTIGSVYPLQVSADSLPRTITLTVVDTSGASKSVQKTIFIDPNAGNAGPTSGSEFLSPLLFASRSKIPSGETVIFKLFNIAPDSAISWDFNGDGKWDIEKSDKTEVEYQYSQSGTFNVRAEIMQVGSTPVVTKAVVEVTTEGASKLKTEGPVAHFLAQKEGNKVSFLSSDSVADSNLVDTNLTYSWDFGDGYKTEGPNPVHVYEKAGSYTVVLTVEDSIERQGVFTDVVNITDITTAFDPNQNGGPASIIESLKEKGKEIINGNTSPQTTETPSSSDTPSNTASQLMLPWWILLILLLPFLPLLYLIKLKIDNPDKDFSTLTHETWEKIQHLWRKQPESHEDLMLEPVSQPEVTSENAPETQTPESPKPAEETTDQPSWMRSYDDNEMGKVAVVDSPLDDEIAETHENVNAMMSESASPEANIPEAVPAPLDVQTGSVPDWLRGETALPEQPEELSFLYDENEGMPATKDVSDNPFVTDHPEWLRDILQPPYFQPEIQREDGIDFLPKPIIEPSDDDVIPSFLSESSEIAKILPKVEEENDEKDWENWDDEEDEDWWNEEEPSESVNPPVDPENVPQSSLDENINLMNEVEQSVSGINSTHDLNAITAEDFSFETKKNLQENNEIAKESIPPSPKEENIAETMLFPTTEQSESQIPSASSASSSSADIPEEEEQMPIKATDAKIPVKESSNAVPEWMKTL